MKYRMLKVNKDNIKKGDFVLERGKWKRVKQSCWGIRVCSPNTFCRPLPEPKRKARPISIFGKMDYPKRRAKMIAVDGHREQIKSAKMPMPKGCNICPLESICKMVGWSSRRCTRALRKAWKWAGGGKE